MKEDWVKGFFYEQIMKYKEDFGIKIYGYRFMDNFAELIGRTDKKENLSKMISRVTQLLTMKYNRKTGRCGTLFGGKFKVKNIQPDMHLLKVMASVDLNFHRLTKDGFPFKFKWTSYHFYSEGLKDPLVDPAPQYLELGLGQNERQKGYKKLISDLNFDNVNSELVGNARFIGDPEWVKKNIAPIKLWNKLSNKKRSTNQQVTERSEFSQNAIEIGG
jgi:hypothetical protein